MMDNSKKRLTIYLLLLMVGILAGIFGYLNAKTTTFEECEKAGLLIRSIRVYDGNGPIEAECVLWGGKSFVKEKSQEQRAVEIATAHLSFPVTIIEVKKLECQGCFSVQLLQLQGGSKWGFTVWVEDTPVFTKNEKVLVFLKKAGREFSVAGWAQGKYIVENEDVRDISGEKVSRKDFLRRVEDAMPPQYAVTPVRTQTAQASPEAPGFSVILAITILLVVTIWRRTK